MFMGVAPTNGKKETSKKVKKQVNLVFLLLICVTCLFTKVYAADIDIMDAVNYLGKSTAYIEENKGEPSYIRSDDSTGREELLWYYFGTGKIEVVIFGENSSVSGYSYGQFCASVEETIELFEATSISIDQYETLTKIEAYVDQKNLGDEEEVWATARWSTPLGSEIILRATGKNVVVLISLAETSLTSD